MKFILCLHAHQPVGNFDAVFQQAIERCYDPFLEVLARHPEIRVSLQYSGSLLEWLEEHAPGYLERVRGLVGRGQVELVTAGVYEPVLSAIPEWDQIAQILAHRAYLRRLFGVDTPVGWLTERVWEQAIAGCLSRAGVTTIPLDEFHFFGAGVASEDLTRPFLNEWDGHLLRLVPASEEMRLLIPFKAVSRVLEAIECRAERGDELLVFADDLEKFGFWPGTFESVYLEGWLETFLMGLTRLEPRIRTVPLGEVAQTTRARARVYLPSGSYPEMLVWSLPARAQAAREVLARDLRAAGLFDRARPFLRGGTWLNFLARYPEVQHIHKRLLDVSRRLRPEIERIVEAGGSDPAELPTPVRELWRAQCNCSYWHGVFGGVYLPRLRHAIFHHLLLAEQALEALGKRAPCVRLFDLDVDLHQEAVVRGAMLEAVVSPGEGGALVELSHLPKAINLVNTLARRPEVYHQSLMMAGLLDLWEEASRPQKLSEAVPELQGMLRYDAVRRACLVDRLFARDAGFDAVVEGASAEVGDFVGQPYELRTEIEDGLAVIHLWREANAGTGRVRLEKRLRIAADAGWCKADYELAQIEEQFNGIFAIELNFAFFHRPGEAAYYVLGAERVPLDARGMREGLGEVTVVHEAEGLAVRLQVAPPGQLWYCPVETVSQSESGYQITAQSAAVLPNWALSLRRGERHHARLRLVVNTVALEADR